MLVTINTDASFSHQHKVGGYAFYIICNKGKILKSGQIKEAKSAMDCEMKAIANAVFTLNNSDLNDGKISKVIINSDCLNSFVYIKTKSSKLVGRYIVKQLRYIKSKSKLDIGINKFYEMRHVKAHVQIKDARSWVNDWCDREAKKMMRKQVKKS